MCFAAAGAWQVLPGQLPAGMAALSGVLDDVYSACGAVAYDEGLQVVRWGPGRLVLLAPIDSGEEGGRGAWTRSSGTAALAQVGGTTPCHMSAGSSAMCQGV